MTALTPVARAAGAQVEGAPTGSSTSSCTPRRRPAIAMIAAAAMIPAIACSTERCVREVEPHEARDRAGGGGGGGRRGEERWSGRSGEGKSFFVWRGSLPPRRLYDGASLRPTRLVRERACDEHEAETARDEQERSPDRDRPGRVADEHDERPRDDHREARCRRPAGSAATSTAGCASGTSTAAASNVPRSTIRKSSTSEGTRISAPPRARRARRSASTGRRPPR